MRRKRFGVSWDQETDVDPMSGVSNLADIMLVFACGLMVALVLRWNVKLIPPSQVEEADLQELTGSDTLTEEELAGDRYQSEGTVYRDTETGRLYIIAP